MRIDVFFKKKIITIYLHPGGGGGRQGREEEMDWSGSIYKGHRRRGWVGGGGGLGEGEGAKG